MYLASIMDDSTIISDEVKESYDEKLKAIPTNFNGKKVTCQAQNFYILLAFLLTTIALLIPVSIYCYLIKYRVKNLSPFHNTSNKLNKFCINSINWRWVLKTGHNYFFYWYYQYTRIWSK